MRQRISSPVQAQTSGVGPVLSALLMAFAVLTLACEEAQSISAAGGAAGVLVSPEAQLLKRSLELTDELQSFRAHVDMDMKVLGQEMPMSLDMLKAANGRIHLTMSMDALAGGMRMEMIVSGEEMFANIPGAGWVRMDASALSGLLGQAAPGMDDPMGLFNNLFPSGDLTADLYNVQSLGAEEVDGVTTEHLLILMDFDKIWREMGKGTRGQFSQLMALSGQPGQGGVEPLGVNEIEVWIDEEGYNRRTVMEINLSEDSSFVFDMRMSGFGDDINIDIPANYTEFSLPGLSP